MRIGIPVVLILIWLVGGSIGGPYFGKVDEVSSNDQSSYLPQTADATAVSERLPDFLGGDSIPAVVVVTGDGALTDDELAALQDLPEELAAIDGIDGDVSPAIVSDDGEAVQFFVPVSTDGEVVDTVEALRTTLDDQLPDGLEAWVTGPAGFTADLVTGFLGIDGLLLIVALGAVFLILIIVYRSPLLPILVLLTSTFALCVALLTVWWLAKAGVLVLNGQVQGILFILVIGAATDYALLYVARFREAVADGAAKWDATTRAWRGAFEPIIASGGTVIAALLCLVLSDLATNRALGPIGAIGIAFAVLSALTFLPALLAVFGRAAFWPFIPTQPLAMIPDDLTQPVKGFWPRQARLVARRARPVWVIATVVLLAASAGMLQLQADGVPSSDLVLGAVRGAGRSGRARRALPGRIGQPGLRHRARGGPRRRGGCDRRQRRDRVGGRGIRRFTHRPGDRRPRRGRGGAVGSRSARSTGARTDRLGRRCAAHRHADGCRGLRRRGADRARPAGEPRRDARRRDRTGRRRDRDRRRLQRHVDPRSDAHHPGRAPGHPPDPHAAAAGDPRAGPAGAERHPLLRRRAGGERPGLQPRASASPARTRPCRCTASSSSSRSGWITTSS